MLRVANSMVSFNVKKGLLAVGLNKSFNWASALWRLGGLFLEARRMVPCFFCVPPPAPPLPLFPLNCLGISYFHNGLVNFLDNSCLDLDLTLSITVEGRCCNGTLRFTMRLLVLVWTPVVDGRCVLSWFLRVPLLFFPGYFFFFADHNVFCCRRNFSGLVIGRGTATSISCFCAVVRPRWGSVNAKMFSTSSINWLTVAGRLGPALLPPLLYLWTPPLLLDDAWYLAPAGTYALAFTTSSMNEGRNEVVKGHTFRSGLG